jgi:hypothetical protein
MISSNVGDSEKPGRGAPGALLANPGNGSTTSSTTKDAGIVPKFVAPLWCTNCRTLVTNRLALGESPPKLYSFGRNSTGTYFFGELEAWVENIHQQFYNLYTPKQFTEQNFDLNQIKYDLNQIKCSAGRIIEK